MTQETQSITGKESGGSRNLSGRFQVTDSLESTLRARNCSGKGIMERTLRTKLTYGFVVLALGMMVTDVCRLFRQPPDAVLAHISVQRIHKF
jgi:hypothetical protein